MEHKLDNSDVRTFVLAGNATFTLLSETTGTRYTYKIRRHKTDDIWFISLLVGNNNDSDYAYIAYMRGDDMRVRTSSKTRIPTDAKPIQAIRYLMDNMENLSPKLKVFHSCKCGRCGRTLTTPESITRGIGPECWDRLGGEANLYNKTIFEDVQWKNMFAAQEREQEARAFLSKGA